MFLIRSAEPRDFKAVFALSKLLDSYNLPADSKFIQTLLHDSTLSFAKPGFPDQKRKFLIVAEEYGGAKVVGCSLIIARHGSPDLPHIAFQMSRENRKSRSLNRAIVHETLKLTVDRSGFTELGGLVILPLFRHLKELLVRQLSFARFALMAWKPKLFRSKLLVEYLPELDPEKGNEFWRVLGARFTQLTYREADRLSIQNKEFILSLFPREKIYCDLLPKSATAQLGVPGPGAKASVHLLEKIGFRFLNQVDPFDGGPHYGAQLKKVSVFRATRFYRYQGKGEVPPTLATSQLLPRGNNWLKKRHGGALVMSVKKGRMRAVLTEFRIKGREILLQEPAAQVLELRKGDRVSTTPIE